MATVEGVPSTISTCSWVAPTGTCSSAPSWHDVAALQGLGDAAAARKRERAGKRQRERGLACCIAHRSSTPNATPSFRSCIGEGVDVPGGEPVSPESTR